MPRKAAMPATTAPTPFNKNVRRGRPDPIFDRGPEADELITVWQFSKRIRRDRQTPYRWIRNRQMPEGSVVMVHGHLYINWTVYRAKAVQVVI